MGAEKGKREHQQTAYIRTLNTYLQQPLSQNLIIYVQSKKIVYTLVFAQMSSLQNYLIAPYVWQYKHKREIKENARE